MIDPSFIGTFSLQFNEELPYTHKSQYYVDATLTGTKNSNLLGNDADNTFRGNKGGNIIDGGKGNDTVILQGKQDEYEIVQNGNSTVVKDTIKNRDGTDTLISIESIQFQP